MTRSTASSYDKLNALLLFPARARFRRKSSLKDELDAYPERLEGQRSSAAKLDAMEVHLNPEVQAKLTGLAAEQGLATQALAQEAIERLVDYDEWFIREVEKGLASADAGEMLTHEEVGARLEN